MALSNRQKKRIQRERAIREARSLKYAFRFEDMKGKRKTKVKTRLIAMHLIDGQYY